ncbi:MAG: MFS transporter [Polyangiales bacterium]
MRISRPLTILALLTLLNFLNYVDRYLVAAVSPAFQAELGLDGLRTGLAISAFMVGYFVTSPVFGWLGDRARDRAASGLRTRLTRTTLMAIGVALWSAATVVSGLAAGAGSLIAARIAVGVGEASYATIAPTIIDDLAPAGKKNRWLAVFYLATPVGSALGYLLGGFLEHRYGWRSAFFVAGGPGILLALSVLFVREPAASKAIAGQVATAADAHAPPRRALGQLLRAPLYLACVIGSCAYTFALGGFAAWAPKFLSAVHRMTLADADFGFGVVAVLVGIVGTLIGGALADRGLPKDVDDQRRLRRYLGFSAWASAIAVPFSVLVLLAGTPTGFFVAIFLCETALFASTSPINAVVLGAVPHALRTTAMATTIFAIHAFGDFLSPPMVGAIADHSSLRLGLGLLPVAIAACAVAWWIGVRLPLVRARPDAR